MKCNFLFFHFYSSLYPGKRCRGKNQNVDAILHLQQLVTGMWGTTVQIKITSGFSKCSLNALRSFPSQHLQDSCCPPTFYLHHFHQLFKSVAQADMLHSILHKWAHELQNVISGQWGDKRVEEFFSDTRFWEGLERHLHVCNSTSEELLLTV